MDDSGVSENIGTILAVAITVILAAIALVFLTNTVADENQSGNNIVAASTHLTQNSEGYYIFTITYMGGTGRDMLESLSWTITDNNGAKLTESVITPNVGYTWDLNPGLSPAQWNPPYRIVVVASFKDKTVQTILTKEYYS